MSTFSEYVKSSVVTFIAAFSVSVLAQWGSVEWTHAGLFALAGVGVRAGVKAILEILALIKPTTTVNT